MKDMTENYIHTLQTNIALHVFIIRLFLRREKKSQKYTAERSRLRSSNYAIYSSLISSCTNIKSGIYFSTHFNK